MSLLGNAPPSEIWVRVLGVLALVVGYHYLACASAEVVAFYRATVAGRFGFAGLLVVLGALYAAPIQLLLFGLVDVTGPFGSREACAGERGNSAACRSLMWISA